MIVLVMGVSGAGKTTIGSALARELGWRFLEADDYHSPASIAKMAAGIALTDADRWPWLTRLNGLLRQYEQRHESVVLACSALKDQYRDCLREGLNRLEVVYLHGSFDLLRERLAHRSAHSMPASLLESQCSILEPPSDAICVDVTQLRDQCVAAILSRLVA